MSLRAPSYPQFRPSYPQAGDKVGDKVIHRAGDKVGQGFRPTPLSLSLAGVATLRRRESIARRVVGVRGRESIARHIVRAGCRLVVRGCVS